jgi:predicted nucleotide-binding protein
MARKRYLVGSKCATGQVVAEILGQSDRACVYTTKDNHLRWEFFANRGRVPEDAAAVVGKFDSLMASVKLLALPADAKRELLLCLGKNLFAALNAKKPSPSAAFADVQLLIQARTGLQARFPRDVTNRNVFIVHGRDEGPRESVARFLSALELIPIILQEQASSGLTIIEKFEGAADVSFAVVLLTPDDVGGLNDGAKSLKPRARQNVVFELGYFAAALGRGRVAALVKGDVEMPSDYQGVAYIALDQAGAWKMLLTRELRKAGLKVDLDRAV